MPSEADAATEQAAADFLRKTAVPIRPRKRWADPMRAAIRFGLDGKTFIPPELRMEEGLALAPYGTGEWGRLVRKGKYGTQPPRFDDRLVEACANMVSERHFEQMPQWIVPVPSRRNHALVGDFADRLSRRLGIPCWHGLVKTADTQPQKAMENSSFQQNNVIDAFGIDGPVPEGGCFLVDDMVDSKWTFTVAAAELRRAGADFVIPLALADSSNEGE